MALTKHMVYLRVPDEDGEGWPQVRCPYLPDSTACGLIYENRDHDPDACQAYDEGEDGCNAESGWVQAPGCAVKEVAAEAGFGPDDLFAAGTDLAALPRGEWFEVNVKWDPGFGPEDSRPVLTLVGGD